MSKTLEILWRACYNMDVGCRYPPKMPYMGCILLLMQPTPLTGTATIEDNNDIICAIKGRMQPTPLTGTATSAPKQDGWEQRMQLTPLTGTATAFWPLRAHDVGCSSHPSRGRLPSTCSGKRHGFCRAFLLCSFPLRPPRLCPCSGLQCLDFGGGGGTPALPLHPNREQVRPFPGG